MKEKGIIFCLFLLTYTLVFAAEANYTITGTVIDASSKEPVEAASISLLNAKDSSYVAGGLSNAKGLFSLAAGKKAAYLLHITYLGYKSFYQNVNISSPNVNVGTISLAPDEIVLQEAVVIGKKPEIIVKKDTVEYDAGSYKTTENAVIEDLLKRLPGVEVDKDGNVTVNGKEVKKFLVDGKEFFTDDPKVASKNLPAEMVDKLQVVNRKSEMTRLTGFDDGDEETVINLTVRQGMKQGTMGNALAGIGADVERDNDTRYQAGTFINHMNNSDRYTLMAGVNNNNNMGAGDLGANQFGGMRMRRGAGGILQSENVMLNFNKDLSSKLKINGDLRFSGMDRNSLSNISETTLSEKQSQLDKTRTQTDYLSDNFSFNMRLDWNPNEKNTFIFRPYVRYNKSQSHEIESLDRFEYYTLDTLRSTLTDSRTKGDGISMGGTLEYAYNFAKQGRVLSTELSGSYGDSYSQEISNSTIREYKTGIFDYGYPQNLLGQGDDNNKNYSIRMDYVEPLGKGYLMRFSYRISQSNSESKNTTYDIINYQAVDTAIINGNQSRSTIRNATTQRFNIGFSSYRKNYNYTLGFNIDPNHSVNKTYQPTEEEINSSILIGPVNGKLPNIMGDSLISEIDQRVVNFSPDIRFRYNFGERTFFELRYEGETNQPTARQLRGDIDVSNPNNWVQGNPGLKPGYSNQMNMQFNKFVSESQLFYRFDLDGSFSSNDITAVTTMLDNGIRMTSYENINGNWNVRLRAGFNTPLKNKRFTVGNFAFTSYQNGKSYINQDENTLKNFSFNDRLNFTYRSDLFDIGINGLFSYSNITYSLNTSRNQNTLNWGAGAYTTWRLPSNFTFESDINWTARSGYDYGYNIPEVMWNAALSKRLFNKKAGTGTLKLQIYDILQDRNNISGSTTTNGFRTTESLSIPSFFMCSFIYKFSIFPKGSSATEQDVRGEERRWGGGGGFRGGGRPPM